MTEDDARQMISVALRKATGRKDIELSPDVHLVDSEILDSLDASVFLLELEKLTGTNLSDQVVESERLFQVGNLVRWLCK